MKKIIAFLVANYYLLITNVAFARLVPECDPVGVTGPKCTLCHLLQLFKNLINLFLEIGMVLAGLFIAWGAFVIMTAGGSEEKVKNGKKILTAAITGVVIALASWLIIATLLQILTGSPSKLPWNQIQCTF